MPRAATGRERHEGRVHRFEAGLRTVEEQSIDSQIGHDYQPVVRREESAVRVRLRSTGQRAGARIPMGRKDFAEATVRPNLDGGHTSSGIIGNCGEAPGEIHRDVAGAGAAGTHPVAEGERACVVVDLPGAHAACGLFADSIEKAAIGMNREVRGPRQLGRDHRC